MIAILASANALTHSYAGLYDWAAHHSLTGWQAMSWPAEIDVFLAIGELALYVACLDGWPARQRIWPWATALVGLGVSIAGNVGHVQAAPGHPVILADRLTAATSPIAAFAGLAIGLLVLKMTSQQAQSADTRLHSPAHQARGTAAPGPLPAVASVPATLPARPAGAPPGTGAEPSAALVSTDASADRPRPGRAAASIGLPFDPGPRATSGLLRDTHLICRAAAASGERMSQRALARQLRGRGHRFSNEHLHGISASIGLTPEQTA